MNQIIEILKKYQYSILSIIIYILQWIFIVYFNPFDIVTRFPTFLFPTLIIEGLLILYAIVLIHSNNAAFLPRLFTWLAGITGLFIGVIFIIFILIKFIPYITFYLFCIFAIIGLLALIYSFYGKKILEGIENARYKSSNNILIKMIFYIPCLFIDLIEYIKKQYKITSSTSLIILLIEIALIAGWFIVPYLFRQYIYHDAKILQENAIYLNKETQLGVFQDITTKKIDKARNNKKFPYKYKYGLSSNIWINPQPQSTNEAYNQSTTLLNYGNILKINFNKNTIEIYAATTVDKKENDLIKIYETSNFAYQKWNNFVFNYSGGTLDVFINNKLVASVENISPILSHSKVTAGYPNGIQGGIKEIIYYDYVLSRFKVYAIYSSLKY